MLLFFINPWISSHFNQSFGKSACNLKVKHFYQKNDGKITAGRPAKRSVLDWLFQFFSAFTSEKKKWKTSVIYSKFFFMETKNQKPVELKSHYFFLSEKYGKIDDNDK